MYIITIRRINSQYLQNVIGLWFAKDCAVSLRQLLLVTTVLYSNCC